MAAERFVPVEEDVDDATAVVLGIAGMAGWSAVERAGMGPDDRVLVLGASGTSGLVAVQGAKLRGAERVVAAGRNVQRLERARELGADETVALDGDLAAACGGDGPTVVIDALWDGPVAAAAEAAAPRARIVHYGQSAGPEATFKSATVRGKELELLGVSNFARTNEELRALHGELWPHDNSLVSAGLYRYGFREQANQIALAMLEAAAHSGFRLPEVFAGYPRSDSRFPVRYPTASSPQAWASAAPFLWLRLMLGIDTESGELSVEPSLPAKCGRIRFAGVHALGGRYDITAEGTTAELVRR